MKHNIVIRAYLGLAAVAIGSLLLLRNLHVISFDYWGELWGGFLSFLLILVGCIILVKRSRWIWGLLFLSAGATIGLRALHIVDVNFWQIVWPILFIAVGSAVLFSLVKDGKISKTKAKHMAAAWSGQSEKVEGKYTGGTVSSVFGGVDLDLRQADIKDGAVIEVFVLFGGVDIIAPNDVVIKNEATAIFGGIDDKTNPGAKAKKTLYIRGECFFGGIELK